MICSACPRQCAVDRSSSVGFCQSGEAFKVARAALHFWEEPCISGKNGSGAVFFSGCNLRCVYCQNMEISQKGKGVPIGDEALITLFERLIAQGAHNLNLVNPTHYARQLAHVLSAWHSPVPIVYNCGGYESVETLRLLEGLVDIYLPDLKYSRAEKALRYAGAADYFPVATAALLEMRRQVQDRFDENGMLQSGVLIRHLVLPQNTNSALEILDWLHEALPDTYVSLLAQYVPCGDLAATPELDRTLTKREYDKVVAHALELGMEKVYLQSLASADKKFIPPFDFTGVL